MSASVDIEAYRLEKLEELKRLQELERRHEADKRAKVDVFALLGYIPNAKQAEFHAATESDVLYGGASGGGKSTAIVAEAMRAAIRHPGIRILLVRRTFDELQESIFPTLNRWKFGHAIGGRWNGTDKELRFSNGSIFRCRYLENVSDASRRQGGEYQLLLIDEATLMPPGAVDILKFERLRSSSDVPVIGCRSTCNPGGPSHGHVKERYIIPTGYGRDVITDEFGQSIRFIQAKATDNPHLDAGYHRRLDAIPDPGRRAAMRDGDWNQFAGMMFSDFKRERHIVEPIELPAHWYRYAGVDWGYAAPWAVVYGAVDEDRRLWIYRELYATQVGETDQAQQMLEAEFGDRVVARFADDAMWATRGDAKPIASIYAEHGARLTPAGKGPGSRIQGWQRIHNYLAEAPACPHHRAAGWDTCPKIHIFPNCSNLLREIVDLPYATIGNPEDADAKASDHAADALRYLILNIGSEARFHFATFTQPDSHIDPNAVGPEPPRPLPRTIGGFPVLHGKTPWDDVIR